MVFRRKRAIWLLKTFFRLNNNQIFNVILTDYDKAMDAALEELVNDMNLPITHLLCHWHLNNNLMKHFAWLNKSEGDDNLPRILIDILSQHMIFMGNIYDHPK